MLYAIMQVLLKYCLRLETQQPIASSQSVYLITIIMTGVQRITISWTMYQMVVSVNIYFYMGINILSDGKVISMYYDLID